MLQSPQWCRHMPLKDSDYVRAGDTTRIMLWDSPESYLSGQNLHDGLQGLRCLADWALTRHVFWYLVVLHFKILSSRLPQWWCSLIAFTCRRTRSSSCCDWSRRSMVYCPIWKYPVPLSLGIPSLRAHFFKTDTPNPKSFGNLYKKFCQRYILMVEPVVVIL